MENVTASVLAKLKNEAKKQNVTLQQLLNLFCQEEFIRRLSKSKFKDNLILKGGFLLYSLSGFTTRATIDADYLLRHHPNDETSIEGLIKEIIYQPSENFFIEFEIRKLEIINEIKEYQGIRANLIGIIGRTKTPFSLDISVGDVIVPRAVIRTLPTLLPTFEQPQVYTYSLESSVAEKLDAIITLMEATGRMKDFYDIYYLATTFDFAGVNLQEAIHKTLSNRSTPHETDSVIVIKRLTENKIVNDRWGNFCKKILKYDLEFNYVVDIIIEFVSIPYTAIMTEQKTSKNWSFKDRKYL